jgi:hypothetical protein
LEITINFSVYRRKVTLSTSLVFKKNWSSVPLTLWTPNLKQVDSLSTPLVRWQ